MRFEKIIDGGMKILRTERNLTLHWKRTVITVINPLLQANEEQGNSF